MATTYEQKKQSVLQLIRTAISFAQQTKQSEYVKPLQEAARRLGEGQFMVVVCGEFRRGKSSLLNALLNEVQDLFPVDVAITTNLVTMVSYGPSEKITALVGPPDSEDVKEIRINRNEIRLYVTEKDNPRNMREARLMTIQLPNEQLKQGLVLVDTPGVGGLYARHTDITYEFIPNADAILYVSDALQPLSEEDLKFIKDRILKHTGYILFVLTKKDRVRNYQEIVQSNREKLAVTLGRPAEAITIIPVSSYAKRNYLKTHDAEDLADSNFTQMESTLWQFINASRGRILLARALSTLGQVVGDIRRPIQVEYDTCREQNKQKLDELEASLEEAREYLQRLQENGAFWQTQLRDGLEDIRIEAQHHFDRGFANIRRNVDGYLADDRVVEKPELVLEPLQRDINDLLYATDRIIREEAADLQSRIEFATGLALNPFEPDSLRQQTRALTLQGMPPAPRQSSSWDNMVSVGQRGNMTGSFLGHVFRFIGGIVGAIFGHPIIGQVLGEGAGYLAGARSGAKQTLQQMHEQNRQHISRYLMSLLADSQKEYGHQLTRITKGLERAMRDDLLDKIKREKHSRERALKSFQDARSLTITEAKARIAILEGPLHQLDVLQKGIEALVQATMASDDAEPSAHSKTTSEQKPPTAGKKDRSGLGDWADE